MSRTFVWISSSSQASSYFPTHEAIVTTCSGGAPCLRSSPLATLCIDARKPSPGAADSRSAARRSGADTRRPRLRACTARRRSFPLQWFVHSARVSWSPNSTQLRSVSASTTQLPNEAGLVTTEATGREEVLLLGSGMGVASVCSFAGQARQSPDSRTGSAPRLISSTSRCRISPRSRGRTGTPARAARRRARCACPRARSRRRSPRRRAPAPRTGSRR